MKYSYAIIGSGKQGTASAYDLIKFGNAEKVIMIDADIQTSKKASTFVNTLTKTNLCIPKNINANDTQKLKNELEGVDAIISGVPYYYNYELTRIAIEVNSNFFDFGGNTEVVKSQLTFNKEALEKNISIVPDCGMDPGLNISLIQYLLETYDKVDYIKSYGAGLLQNPKPPWNYGLSFHINGLTNEYYGNALFINDGKLTNVRCFSGYEKIDFPNPIGTLEAAVTSGGLSTLPLKLENKITTLENKTLRYLGHWERFKGYSELGLFEEEPVEVNGVKIIPRELYHKLLEPKISVKDLRDIGIIKIYSEGMKNEKIKNTTLEIIEHYDENTGFSAMQKLTGWHASIMAILAVKGKITKGAISVDEAINGKKIIEELRKRNINTKIL